MLYVIGRSEINRLNLGSSKRTVCIHQDKETEEGNKHATNMEIYEYCVGSIRNSTLIIQTTSLLPAKLTEWLLRGQYRIASFFAEKYPHSIPDQLFDALYRAKLVDHKTFTSTQANFFPKWCSSISLVRVLQAQDMDSNELMDRLKKEDNPNNVFKGKASVNLGKDIEHELEKENEEKKDEDDDRYKMKDEYQSDVIRYWNELVMFDKNYKYDEMYLILETRYAIAGSSVLGKLLFLPHWITVRWIAYRTHNKILTDLANNLAFVADKDAENVHQESNWERIKPRRKKRT